MDSAFERLVDANVEALGEGISWHDGHDAGYAGIPDEILARHGLRPVEAAAVARIVDGDGPVQPYQVPEGRDR